jgi:hypothetical protein
MKVFYQNARKTPSLQGGDVERGQRSWPCIRFSFKSFVVYNECMKRNEQTSI